MIKELENFEINEVLDIWLKTNIKAHNFIDKNYWINNYELVKTKYIPNSKTLVYKEHNISKGFVSIMNDSFIGALFVLEDYQGKGIGKSLIDYCKNLYPKLELSVYKENTSAVAFYRKCGFKIEKEMQCEDIPNKEYLMKWIK
ncbi:GNAT family N-acetyltransferase [Clostridium baratii]|uniref:GNAT family acetyltransferase n=1 Tax=Clostridium baratii TaxID=1561 RepID=A0A174RCT6_9CLOT|nr:N-acetyltransferase [Clostridium baratii]OPF51349.1 acetyltransferase [Clostridium baratii]OPF55576.1 GNAT family N-acetyltransferase [Clostridium baratii]OPF57045.1 GNAT family N-acetyltransferase [Clostridium baratii]OPF60043.1 GNAT family N-acetyltransferase [Clostridium baratii]CUP81138.1 GNAT family acetyltransferase [Clostridium baratii]